MHAHTLKMQPHTNFNTRTRKHTQGIGQHARSRLADSRASAAPVGTTIFRVPRLVKPLLRAIEERRPRTLIGSHECTDRLRNPRVFAARVAEEMVGVGVGERWLRGTWRRWLC